MEAPRAADVVIDGALGEGGGQVVRLSLALSTVLSRSVSIVHVRSNRPRPGLRAQQVTSANLVARIADVAVQGASFGSPTLSLQAARFDSADPGPDVQSLRADVHTAGSTALVLQAALPPALRFLTHGAELTISGGTTALFAPTSDYIANVLVPNLRHFGFDLNFRVQNHGFFPRGGGICKVSCNKHRLQPHGVADESTLVLRSCDLTAQGSLVAIKGRILVSGQKFAKAGAPEAVRERIIEILNSFCELHESNQLTICDDDIPISVLGAKEATCPCIAVTVWAVTSEETVLGSSSIWSEREANGFASNMSLTAPHKRAPFKEKVQFWCMTAAKAGEEATMELCAALRSGAPVDSHMSDQLCIFMAMAQGTSRLLVPQLTTHLSSVLQVLESFGVDIRIEDAPCSTSNKLIICKGKEIALRR